MIVPDELAPAGYNNAVAQLWLRFFRAKSVPSAKAFDSEMEELYQLLSSVAFPRGRWVGGEQGDLLMKAKLRLDAAFHEAYARELTTTRLDSDPPEWCDSATTSEGGVDGAGWLGPPL
jgi:hypothetical protein